MTPSPKRVLLVDDEASLLESLARALRERGYFVESASDGLQALQIARERPPDLIVTDLRMPVMDGSTLIANLLEDGDAPPVIVATGFATLDAAIDCLRKGAVDFLVKPFDVESFQASVEKAVGRADESRTPKRELDWAALRRDYSLTRRQLMTLQALHTTGSSNKALAERLCVSHDTIKTHLRVIFQKMGVANRTQLFRKLGG